MPKDKQYEKPERQHTFMTAVDVANGKPSVINSIEITGKPILITIYIHVFL